MTSHPSYTKQSGWPGTTWALPTVPTSITACLWLACIVLATVFFLFLLIHQVYSCFRALALPFFSKTSLHGLCPPFIQVSIRTSSLHKGGPSDYIIYKSCVHVYILTQFYLLCPFWALLYGILLYLALLFI